jgi:Ca2+-binding RTX toxin-like protein
VVEINDQVLGRFDDSRVQDIHVDANDGDDEVEISSAVKKSALIRGGYGDDDLRGGGAASILIGMRGNDALRGGSQRDVLLGGLGADFLRAGGGDDILLGNASIYDSATQANDQALRQILAEWTSADSFNDRVANLRSGLLDPSVAMIEDFAADVLRGEAGDDWFLTTFPDVLGDLPKAVN